MKQFTTQYNLGIQTAENSFQKVDSIEVIQLNFNFMQKTNINFQGKPLTIDYIQGYSDFLKHNQQARV